MAALAAAVAGDDEVFLCDPAWGEGEQAQLQRLLTAPRPVRPASGSPGWLCIPTGGSSGRLKFARHDGKTLAAAVQGFARHFGLQRVNAAGVLPLHHVSGLMAWMRCVFTGGAYRPLDWKALAAGTLPKLPEKPDGWVLSLVPTQLERLLRHDATVRWLAGFRLILLGGAAAAPALLERAAAAGLRLAPGYGMTETAAMVTALRPEEFLAGRRDAGRALPHARITLTAEGLICIGGDSLFRGYYPDWREPTDHVTADRGRLDATGHLTVLGRADELIITGGEKVSPAEVEAALRATGEFTEVVVAGVPDAKWGQRVVAAYPSGTAPDLRKVEAALARALAPAKRPKQFVALAGWPASAAGKVNRAEVARRLAGQA